MPVFRCFTERKEGFDVEAKTMLGDLRGFVGIRRLDSLRLFCRYDVEGVSERVYKAAKNTVFSQPQTDLYYDGALPAFSGDSRLLIVEALPGQFDQRADACKQCLQMLSLSEGEQGVRPEVNTARVYVFGGQLNEDDMGKLREYIINPVESREASADKPVTLVIKHPEPEPVGSVAGFLTADNDGLLAVHKDFSLAMDLADLKLIQAYFRDTEKRDPSVTELRVIDTYWSDHCRHTTFFTHITDITIDDPDVKAAYDNYLATRLETYGDEAKRRPITLMDLATISMKAMRSRGLLANMEISEEVNACSIHINANVNGKTEDWLLMFKNETHNHPTEVEPFGGAATCVGGAIRDPLSGRAYVYQAMRVTGAGDPRAAIEDTLPGKLPQRKLTRTAALGNSSYGNQVGLTAGLVHEIYHPGFVAKRMELGAVVGAVKAGNIIRETPKPGDKVVLLGGRTGRDGIGGAIGSSKSQTAESLVTMSAEVQKGNAAEERNIQRLFLDPEVTKMIKKSNDFGAGGVSVAVGELADGVNIDLSLVRTKYEGMDGTEIAISESQERMAIVVAAGNADRFIEKAEAENLEAYVIAEVTESPRMVMRHNGKIIVDIARDLMSTNGAVKHTAIHVPLQQQVAAVPGTRADDPSQRLRALAGDLRYCSQLGLQAMFDDTVGAASVLVKNGGREQSTPAQVMAALLPVCGADTTTCSVMAYGYDPYLSSENPFIGARTAVITSVAKLVAAGCDPDDVYLSFQEFFERLHNDPVRWGKPFSALLGAFEAQAGLGVAAIGGKDSMSGSFNDIDVPPTLVSFAIAPNQAADTISPEFKEPGRNIVIFGPGFDLPGTKAIWKNIRELIKAGVIVSAWAVTDGGIAEGVYKMSLGNEIGFELTPGFDPDLFFACKPGAIIAEVKGPVPGALLVGRTIPEPVIKIGDDVISLAELKSVWSETLENIFPTKPDVSVGSAPQQNDVSIAQVPKLSFETRPVFIAKENFAKPRALVFIFPGTNGDLDTVRAVNRAGGNARTIVIRNMTPAAIEESISEAALAIKESQILIIPGGSSFGDEPDGAAKFITVFFRNQAITEVVHEHLEIRDGLMLGICNGFQALIKLGLVPFGQIVLHDSANTISPSDRPTLTRNLIDRHQTRYVYTRTASVNSPWMLKSDVGDIHTIVVSHGEGRFVASDDMLEQLMADGRVATQYTNAAGEPSMDTIFNPSGSMMAVEGLLSPNGRVFGKMGHTERYREQTAINVYGNKHQPVFESGIYYYK